MNNIEKTLSSEEIRIIGTLIEKELTTPEYYPLTLNSLMLACNQKSNREPVVSYNDTLVTETVEALREKGLVRRVTGSDMRVPKYRQNFTEEMGFTPEETAVMCVLMLRGPQTPGEIKGRTGRMFNFENLAQVTDILFSLASKERPLVVKLPKQAGMKESRYAHLLSGEAVIESNVAEESSSFSISRRIEALEEEILTLKSEIAGIKEQFWKFKKQFE
jgi:uncharacterized protein YceH (UPF0502 family)